MFNSLLPLISTCLLLQLLATDKNVIYSFAIEAEWSVGNNAVDRHVIQFSMPGKWRSTISRGDGSFIDGANDGKTAWLFHYDSKLRTTHASKWDVTRMKREMNDIPLINQYLWESTCLLFPAPQTTRKKSWDKHFKSPDYGKDCVVTSKKSEYGLELVDYTCNDAANKTRLSICFGVRDGLMRTMLIDDKRNNNNGEIVVKSLICNIGIRQSLYSISEEEVKEDMKEVNGNIKDNTDMAIDILKRKINTKKEQK